MDTIHNSQWNRKRIIILLGIITAGLLGSFILLDEIAHPSHDPLMYLMIFMSFFLIGFLTLFFSVLPFAVSISESEVIFHSYWNSKKIKIEIIVGYDEDFINSRRLIIEEMNKKRIISLGVISREIQEMIIRNFSLQRYEHRIFPPYGQEKDMLK